MEKIWLNVIEVMDGNSIFELHKIQKILFKSKNPPPFFVIPLKEKVRKSLKMIQYGTKNVDDSNYEKVKEDIINGF